MSIRLTIRMAAPSVAISLLLLGMGAWGGWYVHLLQKRSAAMVALDVSTINAAEQLVFGIQVMRSQVDNFLLTGHRDYLDAVPEKCRQAERWLSETEKLVDDQEEIRLVRAIRAGYGQFAEELQRLAKVPSGRDMREAVTLLNNDQGIHRVLQPAQELLALEEKLVRQSGDYNQGMAGRLALFLWLLGSTGSVAGLVAGFGIARSVSRSILELYVPIRAASGKLEEVIGPVDLAPSAGIENLDGILHSMADQVGTVVDRLREREREVLRAEQMAALGQLAAGLAHELRNPLTAMKILIQGAVEGGEAARLSVRDLSVLESETARLDRSIQRFLDFARPPRLEKRLGDVRKAIQQVVELVTARANRQGVQVHCALPEQPLSLDADHEQLRQLLLNLVINALDSLPSGGKISISASVTASSVPANDVPGPAVTIVVADNGPGIPADLGDRVFQPYVSTKDTGLGLGLAISRRIVESHGGQISVADAPAGGALFTVQLPCSACHLLTSQSND